MQEVMIRAETGVALQPLVVLAVQKQLQALAHGVKRTQERLAQFEHLHAMSSAQFEQRFKVGELPETNDFIGWWMEIEALQLLESKHHALQKAQVC
jgi:hypothetical protein